MTTDTNERRRTRDRTTEDKNKPDTGDRAPVVPIAVILFISLGGCGVIVAYKKRKVNHNSK